MIDRISVLRRFLPAALFLLLTTACNHEGYETGEGNYSYLRADFAMLETNSESQAVSFVTDDDRSLMLSEPIAISNAKADTVYRALVYYNETSTDYTQLRAIETVYVCPPKAEEEFEEIYTDPVTLQSTWVSANGTYLNMTIDLMTGVEDDDEENYQSIACIMTDADEEQRKFALTFYHNQNGQPEYYSATKYVSIPLTGCFLTGDSLTLNINTYEGTQTKTIEVP